ncbi:hypothetical protein ACIOGZ_23505 [Kitasatospora sp. NPDC088160]|uniref:hypothetical protein n=1 Tax=Kitasatospora sp. NPDC088160 TaxID=3364072 RepID=UPI00382A57C0
MPDSPVAAGSVLSALSAGSRLSLGSLFSARSRWSVRSRRPGGGRPVAGPWPGREARVVHHHPMRTISIPKPG